MTMSMKMKKTVSFISQILALSLVVLLWAGVSETSRLQMRGSPSRINRKPGITGPGTSLPTGDNAALYMNL